MLSKAVIVIKDFFTDGHRFIGMLAPLISITYTACKFWEVPFEGIKKLSYAWALLPLLIWVFIAYIQRWITHSALESGGVDPNTTLLKKIAGKLDIDVGKTQECIADEITAKIDALSPKLRIVNEDVKQNDDGTYTQTITAKVECTVLPSKLTITAIATDLMSVKIIGSGFCQKGKLVEREDGRSVMSTSKSPVNEICKIEARTKTKTKVDWSCKF